MSKQKGNWKRELQDIINRNNGRHAVRAKTVSNRTMEARAQVLFRNFALLRTLGFKVSPRNLGERHAEWLVRYWTCDPRAAQLPLGMSKKIALPAKPYSSAYIQTQLSVLRTFANWIGRPGLIRAASCYARDPELVARHYVASYDHSWDAAGADRAAVIADVAQRDPFVGAQLALMEAFGLRRKEAIMFRPHEAEVPAWAMPASFGETRYLAFLQIKRGTKGGRLRYCALRNDAQWAALERARNLVLPGRHMGRPGLSLLQSLDRFAYVVRACGLSKRALGVTSHGLRHGFACDLYYEISDLPAPIRGGMASDAELIESAFLEVARQLGHSRPSISSAYLGSQRAHAPALGQPSTNDEGPRCVTPNAARSCHETEYRQ